MSEKVSLRVPGYKVPFRKFSVVSTCHVPPLGRLSESERDASGTFSEICRWASGYVLNSFPSAGLDSVKIYGVPDFSGIDVRERGYSVGWTPVKLRYVNSSDVFVAVPSGVPEELSFSESTRFLLATVDASNAKFGEPEWTAVPTGSLIKN